MNDEEESETLINEMESIFLSPGSWRDNPELVKRMKQIKRRLSALFHAATRRKS